MKLFLVLVVSILLLQALVQASAFGKNANSLANVDEGSDMVALNKKYQKKIRDAGRHQERMFATEHARLAARDATAFHRVPMATRVPAPAMQNSKPMEISPSAPEAEFRPHLHIWAGVKLSDDLLLRAGIGWQGRRPRVARVREVAGAGEIGAGHSIDRLDWSWGGSCWSSCWRRNELEQRLVQQGRTENGYWRSGGSVQIAMGLDAARLCMAEGEMLWHVY
ncbi:hypothetical protein CRYUN_Cryun27aG0018400 [Craigia yunnanensis]